MRRISLLVIASAAVAVVIWYAWRISQKTSSRPVSVLLPRETIFLAHLPDFNRTRDQWHHSDLYLLSREPTVEDFLRKLPATMVVLLVSTATAAEPTAHADLAGSVRFEQDRDAEQLLGQSQSAADRGGNFLARETQCLSGAREPGGRFFDVC